MTAGAELKQVQNLCGNDSSVMVLGGGKDGKGYHNSLRIDTKIHTSKGRADVCAVRRVDRVQRLDVHHIVVLQSKAALINRRCSFLERTYRVDTNWEWYDSHLFARSKQIGGRL